jgi:hypothetical protein
MSEKVKLKYYLVPSTTSWSSVVEVRVFYRKEAFTPTKFLVPDLHQNRSIDFP